MPEKKVKDCTIKELENYAKERGFKVDKIEIYKKEIHFERYIKGTLWNSIELVLFKEEIIKVK